MLPASIPLSAQHFHNFLMLRLGHGVQMIDDCRKHMHLKWDDQEENKQGKCTQNLGGVLVEEKR